MEMMCEKDAIPILIRQIFSFVFVAGIGWLIDFSIYLSLTNWVGFPVLAANCISSAPAVLWVFWFSSRRIFSANTAGTKLYHKYMIYFVYQLLLVVGISFFAEYLHTCFWGGALIIHNWLRDNIKILIKIVITPITMTLNFIFMKYLIEKL